MGDLVVEILLEAAQLHKSTQWGHTSVWCEMFWLKALGMFPEVSLSFVISSRAQILWSQSVFGEQGPDGWVNNLSQPEIHMAWNCLKPYGSSLCLHLSQSHSLQEHHLYSISHHSVVITQFSFFCLVNSRYFLSTSKELQQRQQFSGMANLTPPTTSRSSTATFFCNGVK